MKRYFFISFTQGGLFGNVTLTTSDSSYPRYYQLISQLKQSSNKNMDVIIISITELNETDYYSFNEPPVETLIP